MQRHLPADMKVARGHFYYSACGENQDCIVVYTSIWCFYNKLFKKNHL